MTEERTPYEAGEGQAASGAVAVDAPSEVPTWKIVEALTAVHGEEGGHRCTELEHPCDVVRLLARLRSVQGVAVNFLNERDAAREQVAALTAERDALRAAVAEARGHVQQYAAQTAAGNPAKARSHMNAALTALRDEA